MGRLRPHPTPTSCDERPGGQDSQITARRLPEYPRQPSPPKSSAPKDLPSHAWRSIGGNPEWVLPDVSDVRGRDVELTVARLLRQWGWSARREIGH